MGTFRYIVTDSIPFKHITAILFSSSPLYTDHFHNHTVLFCLSLVSLFFFRAFAKFSKLRVDDVFMNSDFSFVVSKNQQSLICKYEKSKVRDVMWVRLLSIE